MNSNKLTRTLIACCLICLKINGATQAVSDTTVVAKQIVAVRDSVDTLKNYAKGINQLVRELAEKQKKGNNN